jgi:glycosyltransferase involved in cell wall biosynthesis
MSPTPPLISVLMTTFNHEKYIAEAVRSVLDQTWSDWEAVIIDDGSTDRTGEIIRSFTDPRIRYLHQVNQGPSVATTTAVAACRGKYVALMSGDDVLLPHRLARQVEAYQRGPRRVLFGGVEYIDDDGRPLAGEHYPHIVKDNSPSRGQLMEQLFFAWPSFFGVTAFMELEVLRECGPDDPALFQTQDYARWVHLLKRYPFEILSDPLYRFRVRAGLANLSGNQAEKQIRAQNERYLVMRTFFQDMPADLFREAFGRHLINPHFASAVEQECEQAFLLLNSAAPLNQVIGMERLHQLLHDPEAGAVLKRAYRFDFGSFAECLKTLNIASPASWKNSAVFVDRGQGWRTEDSVRRLVNPEAPFHLVFNLEQFTTARVIGWAPVEEPCLGRVRMELYRYRDVCGAVHEVDTSELACHSCRRQGDWYIFDAAEPRLLFRPPGTVRELEIAGRLELMPAPEAFARLGAAVTEIEALKRQLVLHSPLAQAASEVFSRRTLSWQRAVNRLRRWFVK